jgi:hypothetical protein
MKMYLLLRNNKQSGPHSADELKSMGLKAYDLVWLEGKSAAWRYPSEIDELSSFAPAVEEQPFDRFYKKASPATTTELPVAVESQRPASSMSSPVSAGKRIIYVTMPAGKSPAARETTARETVNEPAVREIPVREPAFRDPSAETQTPREPIIREMSPSYARAAIEDYTAQPSAGQMTSVDYSPRRTSRGTAFRSKTIARFVAIGLCILALLAAGIFIGLSLNKDTSGLQHKLVANTPVTNTSQHINNPAATDNTTPPVQPATQQLPVSAIPPTTSSRQENPAASTSPASTGTTKTSHKGLPTSLKAEAKTSKEHSTRGGVQYTTAPSQKDSATATIPSMQRESVHRSDNAETNRTSPASVDKEALRTTVANQISVGANNYSVGTFGGISDLQVTVTNRSAYPLDLVVVEVQYVQSNKKVFKTENLYFRGVGAGSALMLEAPKSSRGIKVQYKVTTVNSRELGLPGA